MCWIMAHHGDCDHVDRYQIVWIQRENPRIHHLHLWDGKQIKPDFLFSLCYFKHKLEFLEQEGCFQFSLFFFSKTNKVLWFYPNQETCHFILKTTRNRTCFVRYLYFRIVTVLNLPTNFTVAFPFEALWTI